MNHRKAMASAAASPTHPVQLFWFGLASTIFTAPARLAGASNRVYGSRLGRPRQGPSSASGRRGAPSYVGGGSHGYRSATQLPMRSSPAVGDIALPRHVRGGRHRSQSTTPIPSGGGRTGRLILESAPLRVADSAIRSALIPGSRRNRRPANHRGLCNNRIRCRKRTA